MAWNYRIIKNTQFSTYAIHEVYYKEDGSIEGSTESPVYVLGETIDELRADIGYMQDAFTKPVLVYRGRKLVEL